MSTQKALELLRIPDECAQYEGQVRTRTTRNIVVVETFDFTSGKLVKSLSWEIRETTVPFGAYAFNLISNYIHHFNHEVLPDSDVFTLYKPFETRGTSWFSESKVRIEAGANGSYNFDVITPPVFNVNRDGSPANIDNPPMRNILKVQRSLTKAADGTIKTWTGGAKYVPYTYQQAAEITGMDLTDMAEVTRTTFTILPFSNLTHVTSIAMEITNEGNSFGGQFYVNGQVATGGSSLITSYGKPCPSFVFRWVLYNGAGTNSWGGTAVAQFTASAENAIAVVPGMENSYDAGTRTMTYAEGLQENPKLLAMAEFLPATGKQENAGVTFGLESNLIEIW